MIFFDTYQRTAEGIKDQAQEEIRQLRRQLSESQQSFQLLKFVHFNKDITLEVLNDIIVGCTGCLYSMIFYGDKVITNLAETHKLYPQALSSNLQHTNCTPLCVVHDLIPDYVMVKYSISLSELISEHYYIKNIVLLYPSRFVTPEVLQSVESFMIVYEVLINIVLTRDNMIELIETDPLTKLLNRHLWNTNLQRLTNNNEPFFVIFMDLDYFKDINDTYGHLKGDEVLKLTGTWLSNTFRSQDKVYRLGGDEFAIIGNANPTELKGLIAKFKTLNVSFSTTIKSTLGIDMSISIGILLTKNAVSAEAIYKQVDKMLYASKDRGRNTLSIHSDL